MPLFKTALGGSLRALSAGERPGLKSCGELESDLTASRPGQRGLTPCRRHRSCSSPPPPSAYGIVSSLKFSCTRGEGGFTLTADDHQKMDSNIL